MRKSTGVPDSLVQYYTLKQIYFNFIPVLCYLLLQHCRLKVRDNTSVIKLLHLLLKLMIAQQLLQKSEIDHWIDLALHRLKIGL